MKPLSEHEDLRAVRKYFKEEWYGDNDVGLLVTRLIDALERQDQALRFYAKRSATFSDAGQKAREAIEDVNKIINGGLK